MSFHFNTAFLSIHILALFFSCGKKETVSSPNKDTHKEIPEEKVINLSTSAELKDLTKYIQILEKAYAKLGYKVKAHHMPAVRSLHESNTGTIIDGEIIRTSLVQEMLSNQIKIPVLLDHVDICAFAVDKSIIINGWESLKGKSIATVKGYWYFQKQLLRENRLTQVKTAHSALSQLSENKFEIFVHIKPIALRVIKQQNIRGIIALEPPLESIPTYHFVNKKHAALIPELAKAISEITGNDIEK